ncbi:sporulation histidine kinase inhibitor Sda [Aquibacillus sediminis]|nr:sporulation histidine kinase inhibitor Sda [Aquibacillus sediminis]
MNSLEYLSNEMLIEAYHKAIDLNLESDFVMLLVHEMKKRGIEYIDI